jgi:hypothetical protein
MVADGSMVASMVDRASRRLKSDTSQGLFQTHAATSIHTTMAADRSYPWLSLRATRSRLCGSGPREDVCRQIGQVCIRER